MAEREPPRIVCENDYERPGHDRYCNNEHPFPAPPGKHPCDQRAVPPASTTGAAPETLTAEMRFSLIAAARRINELRPPQRRQYTAGIYVEDAILAYEEALSAMTRHADALAEVGLKLESALASRDAELARAYEIIREKDDGALALAIRLQEARAALTEKDADRERTLAAISQAVEALREPCELRDRIRARDVLVPIYNDELRRKMRLPRLTPDAAAVRSPEEDRTDG